MATWRNGYAEDCKSLYPSSILGVASKNSLCILHFKYYNLNKSALTNSKARFLNDWNLNFFKK